MLVLQGSPITGVALLSSGSSSTACEKPSLGNGSFYGALELRRGHCYTHSGIRPRTGVLRAYGVIAAMQGPLASLFDPVGDIDKAFDKMSSLMDRQLADADRDIQGAMRQLDDSMRSLDRTVEEVQRNAERLRDQNWVEVPGSRGLAWERSSEGAYSHGWSRSFESVSVWGSSPPVLPQAPAQPVSPVLMAVLIAAGFYAVVAARFSQGFRYTKYVDKSNWSMTLMWPFLLGFNDGFREEFWKAMKHTRVTDAGKQDSPP